MSQRELHVSVHVERDHLSIPEEQAVLLFQSVRELLMNVVKHAGTAHATVEMRRDKKALRIEVRDSGSGFDPGVVQLYAGTQPPRFGLFSIRERMKAFGGMLEVETSLGKGTTAVLLLPLEETREETSGSSIRQEPAAVGLLRSDARQKARLNETHRLTVLLVDDHAMMRQGLRSVLEAHADVHIVGEAADGLEAIALVDELRPSIVVMDINMPRLNGIEATARIKARYADIKVIGLSVNSGPNNREAMLGAGADMLLTKEAAVEELYRGIQQVIPRC